jgi:hypothetical protein
MDVELSLTGRASCLRLAGKHDPAGRNRCQSAKNIHGGYSEFYDCEFYQNPMTEQEDRNE